MKNHKKRLSQIVVALLIVYTIGLPIQNIVLANELPTNETVNAEQKEVKESTTAEKNTSNSEDIESEAAPIAEKESESTQASSSEKQESSEKASSTTKQSEKRPTTKAVTSGTFPNGSTATWQFDDATGTLTISGGTLIYPGSLSLFGATNIVFEDRLFLSGDCSRLFSNVRVTNLDLSNLDTSQVTDMNNMFFLCKATSLDVSNFDTSNVTNMEFMFQQTAATSIDMSNFDTSNVTNMRYMFQGSPVISLDVSNFDTSNVTDMSGMFYGSPATSLDLSNFDTSNVTDMGYMFSNSSVTSLDLSSFDTSSVTNMSYMFDGARQIQQLTLGSQGQFVRGANLFTPSKTINYTGKWQNVGTGTVNDPQGTFVGTGDELMTNYTGSTMADTYVWQPILFEVNVQDSTLMVGDTWNSADNFVGATDNSGNSIAFNAITVSGSVDTTQPGLNTVTYSYGGVTSTATITVLETIPASWVNFFVDGTNVRAIPGSALSTANWDLTTGLWDRWNPGTVKVPTDKLPSEPTKTGYEFKGWEDTTGSIVDFSTLDLDLNSQHEFNFYAAFEAKEYTVTFDVEGTQQQETVPFEDLVTEPTVPYKAEYAFTGWYDAKTGGTKWDFSTDTMPARNITLYARFNKLVFVTPEIKPVMPNVVTPIMPGVDPLTPSVTPPTAPPTKPGGGPNVVSPTKPGTGGNQSSSNGSGNGGSGSNTGSKPGGAYVVSPSTSGSGGNQTLSNGSGSNTENMTITSLGNTTMTSQGNTATASPATSSQGGKLAKLGENSSLLLQGFGLLLVLSGMIFFWKKRKKMHL
ncbi:BspA family leucine-rich repeat surface protein [Listeria monocytogenes]|uniref:BspA family leucine-rich repeat surface protein n=1 Tax=Listeria monocytogenes TaxID=1639 RepID=UPI0010E27F07|nr:BspA family leucine-rich repeat surface protein [Listeria monocytogenes]EAC8464481.1 BspA family leucine-rich repeat surface protein [Listeria monocytogenes]